MTAAQQAKIDDYARRADEQRALGKNGTPRRPPASLDSSADLAQSRTAVQEATKRLEQAVDPVVVPSTTAQASVSDPDSRLLPGKHGGYIQGYSLQLAAVRNQILLAVELHDNPADTGALVPMV